MGAFYGSIHVHADEREAVVAVLQGLATRKRRFLISPVFDGWVSVYPNLNGQDDKVSKAIAKRLDADMLHLALHDDDVLYYWFYQRGKLIDKYSSCPDYFGTITDRAKARWRGKPELLQGLIQNSSDGQQLHELLAEMRSEPLFSSDSPQRLSALLGIHNAWTAYEYLMDGETDDIEEWERFVHVPDLSKEQKRQQQIEADLTRRKQALRKSGCLLFEKTGDGVGFGKARPIIASDTSSTGFFVCWAVYGQTPSLEQIASPWSEPRATGMQIDTDVFVMQVSRSGNYLATGHAAGNWKACLWDLAAGQMFREIEQPRLVSWVGFADQERQLVSLSEHRATITEIASGRVVATCEYNRFQGDSVTGAVHSESQSLVVGGQLGVTIIDLNTRECRRTFPVVRHDPMAVIREHLDELGLNFGDLAPEDITPKAIHDAACRQLEQKFGSEFVEHLQQVPASRGEQVCRLAFNPDETLLFCATSGGVRVYEWAQINSASEDIPVPILAADAVPTTIESDAMSMTMAYIYAMAHDDSNQRLIFAGLGGEIRFLDLQSGQEGSLLEVPGSPAILDMRLNSANSALCCVCQPSLLEDRHKKPAVLSVWNYDKLNAVNAGRQT